MLFNIFFFFFISVMKNTKWKATNKTEESKVAYLHNLLVTGK